MNTTTAFEDILKKVDDNRLVGAEKLTISGGWCNETQVLAFIENWPAKEKIPYRIWEYAYGIEFKDNMFPTDFQWLERGRLFGEGGDLSLRRDGNRFRWWFIGPVGVNPPQDCEVHEPGFWDSNPGVQFYDNEETALLWGEQHPGGDGSSWFDDRVANADLSFPKVASANRVEIIYQTYSRAGRVEFVWLRELREWKE